MTGGGSMEASYLRAWIDGLHRLNNDPAVRPVEHPTGYVLLTDTDRAPYVRLRSTERYAPPGRTAPR